MNEQLDGMEYQKSYSIHLNMVTYEIYHKIPLPTLGPCVHISSGLVAEVLEYDGGGIPLYNTVHIFRPEAVKSR